MVLKLTVELTPEEVTFLHSQRLASGAPIEEMLRLAVTGWISFTQRTIYRKCSPHPWALPEVGDSELVCGECGWRVPFGALTSEVAKAFAAQRERHGRPEFRAALRLAFKAHAEKDVLPDPYRERKETAARTVLWERLNDVYSARRQGVKSRPTEQRSRAEVEAAIEGIKEAGRAARRRLANREALSDG